MQNTVTVVIGRKGSGKSTIVREIVADYPRVMVLDSLAEYDDCDVVEEDDCPEALLKASGQSKFRIACRCLGLEDNLDLMRIAYEMPPKTLIVIEEASLYASPTHLPDEMAALIRYGRHRELDLVFVARRPSELHRDVTANADVLVTFQTQEPRDIMYLRSFYGDEALTLPTLPLYHIKVFGDLSKAPGPVLHRLAQQRD